MFGNDVQERIEKRLNRFRRFFGHLVLTVIIALGTTKLVEDLGAPRQWENIIPVAVMIFIAHALWLMYREVKQMIIQQELQREQQTDLVWSDKPKRYYVAEDDGELVEVTAEEILEAEARHEARS
jgi:low temperature requirement protein LtrA